MNVLYVKVLLKWCDRDTVAPEANGQRCENDMSDRVMLFSRVTSHYYTHSTSKAKKKNWWGEQEYHRIWPEKIRMIESIVYRMNESTQSTGSFRISPK